MNNTTPKTMNLKQLLATYGIMAVLVIIINAAIIAGAVWLIVTVLKWMEVL